jgi:hypothetical protein
MCPHGCLSSVPGFELPQNGFHVHLYRRLGNSTTASYQLVALSLAQDGENLDFARRKNIKKRIGDSHANGVRRFCRTERFHELRRIHTLAETNQLDGLDNRLAVGLFQNVSAGPSSESTKYVVVVVMLGHDDNDELRKPVSEVRDTIGSDGAIAVKIEQH